MIVRDYTLKKTDYKGRPTDASDDECPCRHCYNAHDCGKPVPVYKNGVHVSNKYPPDMRCARRENYGCPSPKPEPEHVFGERAGTLCKRCKSATKPTVRKVGICFGPIEIANYPLVGEQE